jgi:hypothetical protein
MTNDLTVTELRAQLGDIDGRSRVYVELGEAEFKVVGIESGIDAGGLFCVLVVD